MAASVKITKDITAQVMRDLQALVKKRVMVGIPSDSSSRDDDSGVTNSELGYIHEFGAPEANIPARPFLMPGIEKAHDKAIEFLKVAAYNAIEGNAQKSEQGLEAAGMAALDSVTNVFQTADYAPLSPTTIRNRQYSRKTKSMRPDEQQYLGEYKKLVANGITPDQAAQQAQDSAGIRPLYNTGDLFKHIAYVIRKGP